MPSYLVGLWGALMVAAGVITRKHPHIFYLDWHLPLWGSLLLIIPGALALILFFNSLRMDYFS